MNLPNYIKILFSTIVFILLFFSCDQEVTTSPEEPEPPKGFIFVDSKPNGFKIFLDGRFTGRFTPDSLPFVEEREHEVTLKREFWKDTSLFVEAHENQLSTVNIDLLQNNSMYGRINFKSNPPGASILLGDSLLSEKTPYTSERLVPGLYVVTFKYTQHRSLSAKVAVQSDQIVPVNIALQDTSIWVDYNAVNSKVPSNRFTKVACDKNDFVWAGTISEGLVRVKGDSFVTYNTNNSPLPGNRIRDIFVDNENNKWIGTENGLVRIDDSGVMTLYNSSNSGLPNNFITTVNQDELGNIWIGTTSGLVKYSSGSFQVYNSQNSNMPWTWVQDVKPAAPYIWTAIDSFVTRFDGNEFEIFTMEENDILNTNITGMDIDKDGKLWVVFSAQGLGPGVVLQGGLGTYDNGWNSQLIGSVPNFELFDIYIDRDDYKWVCTEEGLLKYMVLDNAERTFRPNNSGIVSSIIKSVAEDSKGTLWIASDDALIKYKKYLDSE